MHKIVLVLAAALCLVGCAGTPAAQDGAKPSKRGGKEPTWVSNPRSVYAEGLYVSAVGYGADRESAEKDALGALVAIFGQTVKGETTVSSRYAEAVKNGTVKVTEDSEINRAVQSSFDLESVVGAEIKDTWIDGKTTWAVAVMDKAKASILYANLIETNEETVLRLTDIPEGERTTLDAYARYSLAADIADATGRFLNVLSVISPGAAAAKRGTVSNGDSIRIECLHIAQNIPIAIQVEGDKDDRVAAAFSAAVSDAGFKTGGSDSRYVLRANLSFSAVELVGNKNKFTRYILDAKLMDAKRNTVLLPFNLSGREGHATMSEAENRAVRVVEERIHTEYAKAFYDYLVQLTKD